MKGNHILIHSMNIHEGKGYPYFSPTNEILVHFACALTPPLIQTLMYMYPVALEI